MATNAWLKSLSSDRRFLDPREYPKHRAAIEALRAHPAPGRVYAAATASAHLETWAAGHRLKPAGGHTPCFARLVGKVCSVGDARRRRDPAPHQVPCSDHATLWNRDGKPAAMILQPYQAHGEELADLLALCSQYDVRATVHARSWYFPGATLAIELWAPGVEP